MSFARTALIVLSLAGFTLQAAAESAAPLTADSIQRFLNSLDDVEKLGDKYGDPKDAKAKAMADAHKKSPTMGRAGIPMPTQEQLARASAPFTSSIPEMKTSGGYGEMLATVKRHGFSGVEEWAAVGDRSVRAYVSSQMNVEMPNDMDAQMAEMRESLKSSGMPPQQQEAMLKVMQSGSQMAKSFADVSAADKKAIAPFSDKFEQFVQRKR